MGFQQVGRVLVCTVSDKGIVRLRFVWETNANGDAVEFVREPIDGRLLRLAAYHGDIGVSGTYDAYLYDPYDSDVLDANGAALPLNGSASVNLLAQRAGNRVTPIYAMGRHAIRIDSGAAATYGRLDLFYRPFTEGDHNVA